MQRTLNSRVRFEGAGLHSGRPATLFIAPAPVDHGIVFRRTDLPVGTGLVPARWDAALPARLCTLIANAAGAQVSTIEHVMAALAGCGVHNALIEIDGPEVPILDGSSRPFVRGILGAGLKLQDAPVRALRILEAVEVREGEAVARLEPSEDFEIDFRIDFADAAIGAQSKRLVMANGAFIRELSDCRTFCRAQDVDAMRAAGLALGGTYENAVVVDGARVLTPGGLRRSDEPVRHKMLDALGDLALAGAPIIGRYTGVRAGHAMTNRLLRALFARPTAFAVTACDAGMEARLPGADLAASDLAAVA